MVEVWFVYKAGVEVRELLGVLRFVSKISSQ